MKRYTYQKSIQALHVGYNSMATIITERDVWHLDQQETEAKAERQGVKKMPGETLSKLLPLSFLPPFSPIYAYYAFARQSHRLTFHQQVGLGS